MSGRGRVAGHRLMTATTTAMLVVATLVVAMLAAGCSGADESTSSLPPDRSPTTGTSASSTSASSTSTPPPSDRDRAGVVAAVATERVKIDDPFGPDNPLRRVIVVGRYQTAPPEVSEPSADSEPPTTDGPPIDAAARSAVTSALAPVEVEWVEEGAERPMGEQLDGPSVAVLRLSEPRIVGDHAEMQSNLDCGPMCFVAGMHALQRVGGRWTVTGKIGPELVS